MAGEPPVSEPPGEPLAIEAGAVSGAIAGVAMGLCLHVGTDLLPLLGAFAGRISLLRGWIVHLVISTIYGVVFAALVATPLLYDLLEPEDVSDYALAGLIFAGMAMGAGVAGTIAILPFVLELPWVRGGTGPDVPGPGLTELGPALVFGVGHLVYGLILGTVYAYFVGGD